MSDLRERLGRLFACRCDPAWTERQLHAPDCVEELGDDAITEVAERPRAAAPVRRLPSRVDGPTTPDAAVGRMSLPWDDPGHDVMADLVEAGRRGREVPWRPFEPILSDWQRYVWDQMESIGESLRTLTARADTSRAALRETMLAADLFGRSLNDSLTRRKARLRRMHAAYPRRWRKR